MTSAPPVIQAPNALSQVVTPEPRAAEPAILPAEPPSPAAREATVQRPSDSRAKPAMPPRAPSVAESAIQTNADPTAAPSQPPVNSRQLAIEVATLDEARSAIAAKDGARALEVLRRYAREFPTATLTLEATVLRIQALYVTGSSDAATALGREFLTAHPKSTHASLVRRLLAEHQKP
jgi:TolA-binding protein